MNIYKANILVDKLVFPECPRFRDGKIWFVNVFADELISMSPNGEIDTVYHIPAIGFDWLPDGTLIYVERNHSQRRIMSYKNGISEVYFELSGLTPYQFNELTIDSRGNVYVSNTGNTMKDLRKIDYDAKSILVLIANGKARVVADGLSFPNGIAISCDNKKLIVAETFSSKLTAFDIMHDGSLENKKTFAEFNKDVHPDGIFLDEDGAVWMATASSYCVRVEDGGNITHIVYTSGEKCVACMMDNNKNIYLCSKGNVKFSSNGLLPKTGMIEFIRDESFISKAGYP